MQVTDLLQENSSRPEVLDGVNVQNDPVNAVDPWGLERSEEHTSELQSQR